MELETKVDPEDVVKKWCAAWNRRDHDCGTKFVVLITGFLFTGKIH
jgi:hypothetical protein